MPGALAPGIHVHLFLNKFNFGVPYFMSIFFHDFLFNVTLLRARSFGINPE